MSLQGDDTASRHTSVSKRPGSTVSRAQTLIKRNIATNDLKPSDILIERFQAWKHIVKMLIAYFEGIADIENNTARELTKLGGVIQVPFKAGNQFLGEGGMQDVFYNIRDKTRLNADHHANFAKTVDGSIVQHLQKLRAEIKAHIRNVQNDTGKLAANVAKEREMSTRAITDLAKAINVLKNSPMGVMAREDPYCANVLVQRQLVKQVYEENALQKSIILMQHNSANFEEGIVRSIQSAWQTFDEWQTRMMADVQETWRALAVAMGSVPPTREWVAFAGRSDHLLDPDTPLRNPDHIEYPGKEDPSVIPVHVGLLERKKRFTRSYAEGYFVLTPAGYLHEYPSSDPRTHTHPTFSLFLPACTLGPPSSARTDRSHKFHIESRKDSVPGAGKFHLGSKEIAYTFRARSHEEMMEWWNDIRMLVARYLVASEQIERHGPIEAAVRAAGYISEEEEEDEGEEGGSSIEDEEDMEEDPYNPAHHQQQQQQQLQQQDGAEAIPYGHEGEEAAPAYTAPGREMALTMGPNGYPLEKKQPPLPNDDYDREPGGESSGVYNHGPPVVSPSTVGPTQDAQMDDGPIAESNDLRRRMSRRQEKAPEGRTPKQRPMSLSDDLMPPPAPRVIEAPRPHEPEPERHQDQRKEDDGSLRGSSVQANKRSENSSALGSSDSAAAVANARPNDNRSPQSQPSPGPGFVPSAPGSVLPIAGAIDFVPGPPGAQKLEDDDNTEPPKIGYVPTAPPPVTMNIAGAVDFVPRPPGAPEENGRPSFETSPPESTVGSVLTADPRVMENTNNSSSREMSPAATAAVLTASRPGFLGAPIRDEPQSMASAPGQSVAAVAEPARSEQAAPATTVATQPAPVISPAFVPASAASAGAPAMATTDSAAPDDDGATIEEPFVDAEEAPEETTATGEGAAAAAAAPAPTATGTDDAAATSTGSPSAPTSPASASSPTARKASKLSRKERRKSREESGEKHGLFSRFKEALK